ncbi:cobyrinate a,c-diamide synthase [Pelagibius litoralis]|uniref:Cobyrinate a,c-diamide synthase n=1 Tax=Pelagibius litoralis TaxID=374515 RepID=A0A967EVV6_9PROT|nr:cobyrinate a,c-diamide synthase [Pelagibius litoralis]NIA69167.1 cobyrinate a,c-diamide synthase [Pelagibius litoralis]
MTGSAAGGGPAGPGPAGLLIAAPASGSGKTTVTLALLRYLRRLGHRVSAIKVGPDYIDPGFHAAASGRACLNLDSWAMREQTLAAALGQAGRDAELIVGEGVMGLFDGAAVTDGHGLAAGSTASLAAMTAWPVILVVDCKGMAASVAALVRGFAAFHEKVALGGVILNSVASERHECLLRAACHEAGVPVLGALRRMPELERPSRHLGLVQAGEDPALERFLETAASALGGQIDVPALLAAARPFTVAASDAAPSTLACPLAPLGQRIAVARDVAFAFCYPLVLAAWRDAGAEVSFFSPLADEGPDPAADAVYLPGGYPELHAVALAANRGFRAGMQAAVARNAVVYGECGGYMVLGSGLEDSAGQTHEMLGLLPLESSLMNARRSLGYRRAEIRADGPLGRAGTAYRAHEFHYAMAQAAGGDPLFQVAPASGQTNGAAGQRQGCVMGSFLHLIDREGRQ